MAHFMPVSNYRPNVLIGNWFEDICLEQEKTKKFKHERASGQLLIDKTRILFNNFHKEIDLEAPSLNIRIGCIVQIMPLQMNICEDSIKVKPALSVVINERVVHSCQNISDTCELTIAPTTRPIVRNSFRLISAKAVHLRAGDTVPILRFGEHFRLECLNTPESLYVYSINKSTNLNHVIATTYDSYKFGEINLPLGLVYKKNLGPGRETPLATTNWFCQHVDPKKRFETYLTPIESNTPVVITHAATNRNLAAENMKIQTLFGPEFLVSVTNHKNVFQREKWNNIWKINNG